MKILDSFFINRLQLSDPLKPAALALRLVASGTWNVTAAAERIGVSERQLERRSHACSGVSRKGNLFKRRDCNS